MNFPDSDSEADKPTTRVMRPTRFVPNGVAPRSADPGRAPAFPARDATRPVHVWPGVLPVAPRTAGLRHAPAGPTNSPLPGQVWPRQDLLVEPQAVRRWPLWVVVISSSMALVAAGYLGALVQVSRSHSGPVVIPRLISESRDGTWHAAELSQPVPAALAAHARHVSGPVATANAVAPAPSVSRPALERGSATSPKVRIAAASTALRRRALQPTAASITAELYRQKPPVMTIRALPAQETAASTEAVPTSLAQAKRQDVQNGLERVRDQLVACAAGRHGTVSARVTIAANGRVNYSLIEGAFVGTPEGSCMARALRSATFPPFEGPSLKVVYPFRL